VAAALALIPFIIKEARDPFLATNPGGTRFNT